MTDTLTAAERAAAATVALPPFSGDDPACTMCGWAGARTRYRPAMPVRRVEEFNGRTAGRGPLPERLERECSRCDYQWDEALSGPADQVQQLLTHPDTIPVPLLIAPHPEQHRASVEEDVLFLLERCPESARLEPAIRRDLAGRLLGMADIYPLAVRQRPHGRWPGRATREDIAEILSTALPDMIVEGRSVLGDAADALLQRAIVHLLPEATT